MADRLQVNVRLETDLDKELEEYRRGQPRIPTRSNAIKDLLREALKCAKERQTQR